MSRPLDGLRVLDFSHVVAGPFATRILADMGADVVRVNSATRATGANDPHSGFYVTLNRNKRSLALDMTRDESREIGRELADKADIVIDNFSPGVLDRWGLGFDTVRTTNPGVIYIEMSGMGDSGPWSKFVTFAPTIHALAGLSHLTGVPGREDIGLGFSYNDHQAGLHGAVAILAALESRRRTGRGQRIDVSQFELGVNFSGPSLLDWFANGRAARPTGNGLPYDEAAPHNCYRCKDDARNTAEERWVAIAVMNESQWQAFKALVNQPEWTEAAQFTTAADRIQHVAELDQRVSSWTATLSAEDVMRRCQEAGVPAGVVQTAEDLIERDPQLASRGFLSLLDGEHAALGDAYYDALPVRFSRTACNTYAMPGLLGADNAAILEEWLGMTEEDVEQGESDGYLS